MKKRNRTKFNKLISINSSYNKAHVMFRQPIKKVDQTKKTA